jgi:hypothetical protein
MPSLNQYRGLFRDTLEVPNATMDMLVTDLLDLTYGEEEGEHEYAKELLQEIARLRLDDEDLERLDDEACWPCRTQVGTHEMCSIGDFYVNDRQDLFDTFSESHTFLDFDFLATRKVADLLRSRGCDSFLSNSVCIETESLGPLERNPYFTRDFRGRSDALVKYTASVPFAMLRLRC